MKLESFVAPQTKPMGSKKFKILIVDDHPVVREGLTQVIIREIGLAISADGDDPFEVLKLIAREKPDAVIVDISLKNSNGMDLLKNIHSRYAKLPVLVLSMHDESLYAERVLHAGGRGYIMKGESNKNVVTALNRVLRGEIYVSDKMADKIVSKLVGGRVDMKQSPLEILSDRELQVFEWIGRGLKTREIAERLCLSTKTINTYREHIKEKLKLESAIELIQHAIYWVQHKSAVPPTH